VPDHVDVLEVYEESSGCVEPLSVISSMALKCIIFKLSLSAPGPSRWLRLRLAAS
jgi:hypothetical protein